jgi:hypothetical protein
MHFCPGIAQSPACPEPGRGLHLPQLRHAGTTYTPEFESANHQTNPKLKEHHANVPH